MALVKRRLLSAFFFCTFFGWAFREGWTANLPAASEYQVKGAFLYNFAKFVDWPEAILKATDEPFVIGVLGKDPFGKELDAQLDGQTVHEKKVVIRRFSDLNDVSACHVLFISSTESKNLGRVLNGLGTAPVLTVGDFHHFTDRGGMIGFSVRNKKIRFDINPSMAERAGLKISGQLLRLAENVDGKPNISGAARR